MPEEEEVPKEKVEKPAEEKKAEKPAEEKPEEKRVGVIVFKEPEKTEEATPEKKGWFKKIPSDVLLSPGGFLLIAFAIGMEILDLIPIPFIDQLWELPLEIIFIILLAIIAKVPLKASLIPFLIERIPVLSDICPTWILRMLA